MSVVIFTMAELTVLSTMLAGLIRKRAHAVPARSGPAHARSAAPV